MSNLQETLKTLTTLEKAVLTIMSKSDFEGSWLTYYDEIDYENVIFAKNQLSGILSSLSKKGLTTEYTTNAGFGEKIRSFQLRSFFASDNFEDVEDDIDMTEQIEEFLKNN